MNPVLLVDDEPDVLRGLKLVMAGAGISAETALSAEEALERLRHAAFDVLVTDYRLGGMDGLELLRKVRASWPSTRVVMITAYGTIENAVEAMARGALRYVTKPFESADLVAVIREALEESSFARELEELRGRLACDAGYGPIVTRDRQMLEVLAQAEKIAPTSVPVLIEGESGTGKELLARLVHNRSPRAARDFVAINTAALPEALLEGELFGFKKGAFTGAATDRKGYFAAADGGTVFLDEIAAMPAPFQSKLLRVLETLEVVPLGTTSPVKTDFRIICATNRPMADLVRQRLFREDLFYRIGVVHIKLPALRDRPGDIPLLTEHFVRRCAEIYGMAPKAIDPTTHRILAAYPWPGNVRELWNVVQRAFLLSEGPEIAASDIVFPAMHLPDDLEMPFVFGLPYEKAREQVLTVFQRDYFSRLIRECEGNLSEVARRSSLTRSAVYKIIRKLGLQLP